MPKSSLKITAFFVLALTSSVGTADIGDGKWFLDACSTDTISKLAQESKEKAQQQLAYCSAFVMGILHGHLASRAAYKQAPLFCAPPGRSYFELLADVVGIVGSKTNQQSKFTSSLALDGLARMYPCKS